MEMDNFEMNIKIQYSIIAYCLALVNAGMSNSNDCRTVCENHLYEIATINGGLLRSDGTNALWYVKRIDDYPTVLIINYQSHVMIQLNWSSMIVEQTHDCSKMNLLKLEEHPTLKSCYVIAVQNGDTYFIMQRSGALRAANNSLANQSLNIQDLRCFNFKQDLPTPAYPDECYESSPQHSRNNMTYAADHIASISEKHSTTSTVHGEDLQEWKFSVTEYMDVQRVVIRSSSSRIGIRRKFTRKNLSVTGTHLSYPGEHSEQMWHFSHGISTKKVLEVSNSVGKIQGELNATVTQQDASSSTGSGSIFILSTPTNRRSDATAMEKSSPAKLTTYTVQSFEWQLNSTTTTVRNVKFRTTKPVIFHHNTKYLRKKGNSVNCCNILIILCTLFAIFSKLCE